MNEFLAMAIAAKEMRRTVDESSGRRGPGPVWRSAGPRSGFVRGSAIRVLRRAADALEANVATEPAPTSARG